MNTQEIKKAVAYIRVSSEHQASEGKTSIEEQRENIEKFCKSQGFELVEVFTDCQKYVATQRPNKGKLVQPSGTRIDRPAFLNMLNLVKTGKIDCIVCWRNDRLYRHEKVVTKLQDAMEIGEEVRNQRKIKIYDVVQDITSGMYEQARKWRDENERRVDRFKSGKIGKLKAGYWPGAYKRYGYKLNRTKLGNKIVKKKKEAKLVKNIFKWCDSGLSLIKIREKILACNAPQKAGGGEKIAWDIGVIYGILRSPNYLGYVDFTFNDGQTFRVKIPQLIDKDLWERVQKQLKQNKSFSKRNTKGVYPLQSLVYCGSCGCQLTSTRVTYMYYTLADGTKKKRPYKNPYCKYRCYKHHLIKNDERYKGHKVEYYGPLYDNAVWSFLVENVITKPEILREQIKAKQEQLLKQSDNFDNQIKEASEQLSKIEKDRLFLARQTMQGNITEGEYNKLIKETKEKKEYWENEITQLTELQKNACMVNDSVNQAITLIASIKDNLATINQTKKVLQTMPTEQRKKILLERQKIIRALCNKIILFPDGKVEIEGLLNTKELPHFNLKSLLTYSYKIHYDYTFNVNSLTKVNQNLLT